MQEREAGGSTCAGKRTAERTANMKRSDEHERSAETNTESRHWNGGEEKQQGVPRKARRCSMSVRRTRACRSSFRGPLHLQITQSGAEQKEGQHNRVPSELTGGVTATSSRQSMDTPALSVVVLPGQALHEAAPVRSW